MRRHDDLWEELTSFSNLLAAAKKARRGKLKHPSVAAFEENRERELCRLQDELRSLTYQPGSYRTFEIREPKPRLISAAPYRDRVVHHTLCRILERVFEPIFIVDSYACRKGKGTHAAVDRFQQFARQHRYVLQCDVAKYFPSIDHEILKSLVARKIKDENVLWLTGRIIDHSNAQEPVWTYYPGDDLFTPGERRRGLPLGNQTSQFLANLYLNALDYFVKQTLRATFYLRYVDDFVLFHDDRAWLADARERCREFLSTLRLRLHPRKAVISRTAAGTRFLGYRVFPEYRLLPRENVTRMRHRLRGMRRQWDRGQLKGPEARARLASWLGHAGQADTIGLCRSLLKSIPCCWRP